jgi:hypothetical protein
MAVIAANVPVAVGRGRLVNMAVVELTALFGRFPVAFFAVAEPVDGNTCDSVWGTFLVTVQRRTTATKPIDGPYRLLRGVGG